MIVSFFDDLWYDKVAYKQPFGEKNGRKSI